MNTTDLPPLIRECVDGKTNPVTFGEIKARAALTERAVRRVPARRGARLGAAVTGLAAAGIAGALVASQAGGGTAAGSRLVLTAAMLKHVAATSQAAMTSGQAEINWTDGGSPVVQDVAFDGANWNDVMNPGMPLKVTHGPHGYISWTGESVNRVVDGQAYHYPSFSDGQVVPGWMHITAAGSAQSLNIPDPRTLLGVLSPSAGFVSAGYTTVDGVKSQRLRATTPAAVPVAPLDPIIQSEPDNARVAALDLWVNSSDVVLKAQLTVTGTDDISKLTAAGRRALEQYAKAHNITVPVRFQAAPAALARIEPGVAALLKQPGMVTVHSSRSSVTVTVTFSQIGQPQAIPVPSPIVATAGRNG